MIKGRGWLACDTRLAGMLINKLKLSIFFWNTQYCSLWGGGVNWISFWIVGFCWKKCLNLDLENILYRFADLINTADCGFIQHFCSDCRFCLQFSSDPGLGLHSRAFSGSKFRQSIVGFCFKFGRICRFVYPYSPPLPPDPPLWFIVKNLTQIHLPIFETINYVLECSLSFPMNEGMNACNQVLIDSCFTI